MSVRLLQDTNDDGYLSFEELQKGMEDAGSESETCNEAAKAVMAALDVSGDGFIEYHEFLAAVLDRQQILTDQTIAEMFCEALHQRPFILHEFPRPRTCLGDCSWN